MKLKICKKIIFDPRGEPPIPGVYDECFDYSLRYKRILWRRWKSFSIWEKIYKILLWKIKCSFPWRIERDKFVSVCPPNVKYEFPVIDANEFVSVQPMLKGVKKIN